MISEYNDWYESVLWSKYPHFIYVFSEELSSVTLFGD